MNSPVSGAWTPAPSAAESATAPLYQRLPALDALFLDDGRVVLLVQHRSSETRVLVLDGIAPTLWRATARPVSIAELVEAVTSSPRFAIGGGCSDGGQRTPRGTGEPGRHVPMQHTTTLGQQSSH